MQRVNTRLPHRRILTVRYTLTDSGRHYTRRVSPAASLAPRLQSWLRARMFHPEVTHMAQAGSFAVQAGAAPAGLFVLQYVSLGLPRPDQLELYDELIADIDQDGNAPFLLDGVQYLVEGEVVRRRVAPLGRTPARVALRPAPRPAARSVPRPSPRVALRPAPRLAPRPSPRVALRPALSPAPRLAVRPALRPAPRMTLRPARRPSPRAVYPSPRPLGRRPFARPSPSPSPSPRPFARFTPPLRPSSRAVSRIPPRPVLSPPRRVVRAASRP